MEAARAAGVSWRRWHGWEPSRLTTYTYDEAGRCVASVTTMEPEWDDVSRAHLLALLEYEAGLCAGCGRPLSETTNPLMDGRFIYDGYVECFCCLAIAAGSAKAAKGHDHPHVLLHDIKTLLPREKRLGEA